MWSPHEASSIELDLLARIMYLYDAKECGHSKQSRNESQVILSQDTKGFNVLPIRRAKPIQKVYSRWASKTRRQIEISVGFHTIWMVVSILLLVLFCINSMRTFLKFYIRFFLFSIAGIITFDVFMAIIYITHISQASTKAMVVRYSGWSDEFHLKQPDEFGGWVPIAASAAWMRGLAVFAANIYCFKVVYRILKRIQKKEVRKKLILDQNLPLPEAYQQQKTNNQTLYFRSGEDRPYTDQNTPPARNLFYDVQE